MPESSKKNFQLDLSTKKWIVYILSIALIVLGVCLLIWPNALFKYVLMIGLFVFGIYLIFSFLFYNRKVLALFGGILSLALAILFIINILTIIFAEEIMIVIAAIWALITGISCFGTGTKQKKRGISRWGWPLSEGVLLFILAVLIFAFPQFATDVITTLVEILLAIFFITYGLTAFFDAMAITAKDDETKDSNK